MLETLLVLAMAWLVLMGLCIAASRFRRFQESEARRSDEPMPTRTPEGPVSAPRFVDEDRPKFTPDDLAEIDRLNRIHAAKCGPRLSHDVPYLPPIHTTGPEPYRLPEESLCTQESRR